MSWLRMNAARLSSAGILLFLISLQVQAQEYKNLKIQADELGTAYATGDFDRFIDLTFPKLVTMFGGRDKMKTTLREDREAMGKQGFTFLSQKAEPATQVLKIDDRLFAVVPVKLQMKVPDGIGVMPSCMIGVSTDQGEHWTFADASGDPEGLKTIIPEVAKLKLPPRQKLVVYPDRPTKP